VLGAQIHLSHDRSWAHLASYPSGHLIVTTAMAAAAAAAVPWLRRPLLAYVVLVGITRVTFGAHFPLDVLVGAVMGYEIGLFSTALLARTPLLPARAAGSVSALEPERGLADLGRAEHRP
jgi:membrane-associated phospholipid phosphatase